MARFCQLWTSEEDAAITARYTADGAKALAEEVGRTEAAIRIRASRLATGKVMKPSGARTGRPKKQTTVDTELERRINRLAELAAAGKPLGAPRSSGKHDTENY
jgi:hypothetical protein